MSALYRMQYQGIAGFGGGVLYIGRGKILGMDMSAAHYDGWYTDQGGRFRGTLTMTSDGGGLVTGQPVPPGTQVQITFDWPTNFAIGQFQPVLVGDNRIMVALSKIGDVP